MISGGFIFVTQPFKEGDTVSGSTFEVTPVANRQNPTAYSLQLTAYSFYHLQPISDGI